MGALSRSLVSRVDCQTWLAGWVDGGSWGQAFSTGLSIAMTLLLMSNRVTIARIMDLLIPYLLNIVANRQRGERAVR